MAIRMRGSAAVVVVCVVLAAAFVALGVAAQAGASAAAGEQSGAALADLYDVAVDVGSATAFTDSAGIVWQADTRQYPNAAGWGWVTAGLTENRNIDVLGTTDDRLYQTIRYWNATTGSYKFDVPTGTYAINLRFADLWNGAPLNRQFDVSIEGVKYLSYMDIVSAAGANTVYDWTFVVTITTSPLNINFVNHAGSPLVNGIRVTQLASYDPPPSGPYPRIGIGVNWAFGQVEDYDVAPMHFGWYSYWNISEHPARPNGIEYVQLINTRGLTPANIATASILRGISNTIPLNPGSTWIIGNEIEASYQGNHTPGDYARIFHYLYTYIKNRDANARIAIGGVTMFTQARQYWLDQMESTYKTLYGAMPADVIWTIHEQIVGGNEALISLWPVGIPSGAAPAEYHSWVCGQASGPDDFAQFKVHVNRMRAWMFSHGYRDRELWISEYGVLGGDQYNCTQKVIGAYVKQTMEWLNTATSATQGMPSDENRIVQRWLWYSMNDQPYTCTNGVCQGFSGALFDRASPVYPGAMTGVGRAFLEWVSNVTPPPPTATPTITPTPTESPTPTPSVTPTATRTELPVGSGMLQGQVTLQGRGAPPTPAWQVPLNVRLFLPGDNLPAYQFDTTTDVSGTFSVPGAETPGLFATNYDIKVKNAQALQAVQPGVILTDTAPTQQSFGLLRGGDANNDNRVSLADVSVMAATYNKSEGNAGYDARADFGGDGKVGLPDLSVLASNYNKLGLAEAAVAGDSVAAAGEQDTVAAPEDGAGLQAAPSVSLVFSPPSTSIAVGTLFNVELRVIIGGGPADAVDFTATYNPSYLAVSSVTCNGTLFTDFQTCTAAGGNINFTGSIFAPKTPAAPGTQFLMRVTFRATAPIASTPLQYTSGQGCLAGACAGGDLGLGTVTITNPPTPTRTPTICPGCPTNTPTATPAPLNLGVNVGGAAYTDHLGFTWQADQAYTPGSWGYQGGQVFSTNQPIGGTDDDPLYQVERYSVSAYIFDLLPGTYSVTMKFAELYAGSSAGSRVFSVKAEGYPYIEDLDVLAETGSRYMALDRSFIVAVNDYQLNLVFTAKAGAAKVNAIRLQYLGGGPATATPTPTETSLPGTTSTPTATGTTTAPPGNTATRTATPTATQAPRDPFEPNNGFDQATDIQAGINYDAYIDYPDDLDFYALPVGEANSFIWVQLTSLPDDYDLFLYGPDRTLVAWSTYGGQADEFILDYPVGGRTGTYYLRVLGYARSFAANDAYRLRVDMHHATPTATPTRTATAVATATATATVTRTATGTATPQPLDRFEPNNTFEQATSIIASTYNGFIDYVDDVDFYKFNVSQGQLIAAALLQLPADYDLYLADASRTAVAWSRYGGAANEYLFYTAPSSGVYYLWVVGYNHAYDPTGSYRLVLQLR